MMRTDLKKKFSSLLFAGSRTRLQKNRRVMISDPDTLDDHRFYRAGDHKKEKPKKNSNIII